MKVLNAIANGAIVIGLVLLFGAAGADEQGTYTMTQVIAQVSVSAVLLIGGLVTKAAVTN